MAIPVPFKIKHFDQAVASMLNWMVSVQKEVTDANIGSVNRTLFEAWGMELEEFYFRMVDALEQAIPDSAYESFDFGRQPSTTAAGVVTFSRSTTADQDYLIPAGTIVSTNELVTFQTVADVTLLTGQMGIIASIIATQPGTGGNVNAGSITVLNSALPGIEAVTNSAATTGGVDEESREARAERFRAFIEGLARTTIGGVEAGALTAQLVDGQSEAILESVRQAKLVEPYLTGDGPRCVVEVYIDNGSGVASVELIAETQKIIDGFTVGEVKTVGYRAAGVTVNVVSVTSVIVPVTTTVTLTPGADQATTFQAVQDSISQYFTGLGIQTPDDPQPLDWERLSATILTTVGVSTAVLESPTGDVTPQTGERIILGTVTIS